MIVELLVSLLIVVSGVFGLVGSYGLVKLPDMMTRLHAPTKATTLGVGGVLLASMLFFWVRTGAPSLHELVITVFLFLTAPISANFLAKAQIHTRIAPEDLPGTGTAAHWGVQAGGTEAERGEEG